MTIKIYNIEWDISDCAEPWNLDLPTETEIDVDPVSIEDCDVSEFIADVLSDVYEYATTGFNYEIVGD